MQWKVTNPQTRLYLMAAFTLLVGSFSAVLIYLTADNTSDSMAIHDLLNSKKYIHDLNTYGGNVTVLADRFFRWFHELWQGEALAYTVAWLTLVISCGFFFVAYHVSANAKAASRGDDKAGGNA